MLPLPMNTDTMTTCLSVAILLLFTDWPLDCLAILVPCFCGA